MLSDISAISSRTVTDIQDIDTSLLGLSHDLSHPSQIISEREYKQLEQQVMNQRSCGFSDTSSQAVGSLAHDDLSDPSFSQIISEREYKKLEQEVMNKEECGSLVPSFFNPYQKKSQGCAPETTNLYYADYLAWKEHDVEQGPVEVDISWNLSDSNYLMTKKYDDCRVRAKLEERNQEKSYKQMKQKLSSISSEYRKKIDELIKGTNKKQQEKQKQTLDYYRIQYPELRPVSPENEIGKQKQYKEYKEKREQKEQKKGLAQMYQTSFINMIKNPPREAMRAAQIDLIDLPIPNLEEEEEEREKKLSWRLDIDEILKMGSRQFIFFFNQYERKLFALTSPQDMKRLTRYRAECLEKQESLQNLKKKLALSGDRVLAKLSPEKKRQLFDLLYENQLEDEIEKLSMSL